MKTFTFVAAAAFICACGSSPNNPANSDALPPLVDASPLDTALPDARVSCPLPALALATTFVTATGPKHAAIGDLNADGKADIAVIHEQAILSVYLGNGDFTFRPRVDYSLPFGGDGVDVGDVNGDGENDVVVAGYYGSLSVFLGTGGGTLGPRTAPYIGGLTSIISVVLIDLNGDGKLDIVGGADTGVVVLLAKASGGFETPVTYSGSFSGVLKARDVNGDGKPDVVALAGGGAAGTVRVYLSNGTGALRETNTQTVGPTALGLGVVDVDLDQHVDIVTSTFSGLEVMLGVGDGTFGSPIVTYVDINGRLAVGDIDLDGRPDAAIGREDFATGYAFAHGTGNGTFVYQGTSGSNGVPGDIQFADFDRDGRLDVFLIDKQYGEKISSINIYRNVCGGV